MRVLGIKSLSGLSLNKLMANNEVLLSIEDVAKGLKVKPEDVLGFVSKGVLKGVKQPDGTYKVAAVDYQAFGQSMHREYVSRAQHYMWESMLRIQPEVQNKVAHRFYNNIQIVLDRAEKAVLLLERFHKKYEPEFDVFEDKCGKVAGFVVYARVVSLLHSILNLLRNAIPSESLILFRPLWEAILLAKYFVFSDLSKKNSNIIRKWFENDEIVSARDVRKFLDGENYLPMDLTRKAQEAYSKPMHHTYKAIMESYRAIKMSGMGEEKIARFGFDYNRSRIMRDIVEIVSPFERLLLFALQGFKICFSYMLNEEELKLLDAEIGYYSLDSLKRLEIVFSAEKAIQKRGRLLGFMGRIYSSLRSYFVAKKIGE